MAVTLHLEWRPSSRSILAWSSRPRLKLNTRVRLRAGPATLPILPDRFLARRDANFWDNIWIPPSLGSRYFLVARIIFGADGIHDGLRVVCHSVPSSPFRTAGLPQRIRLLSFSQRHRNAWVRMKTATKHTPRFQRRIYSFGSSGLGVPRDGIEFVS